MSSTLGRGTAWHKGLRTQGPTCAAGTRGDGLWLQGTTAPDPTENVLGVPALGACFTTHKLSEEHPKAAAALGHGLSQGPVCLRQQLLPFLP